MLDFIRITLAVPSLSLGVVEENEAKIKEKIEEAKENGADMVLFPELSLTGATLGDLLFQESLLEEVNASLTRLADLTKEEKMAVVLGAPVKLNGLLYNAAFLLYDGAIRSVVPKAHLLSSGGVNEKRWFASGLNVEGRFVLPSELGLSGDQSIYFGMHQIFQLKGRCTFGIEVGQDLFSPLAPSTELALKGAEMICNIGAFGEMVGQRERREATVANQSTRNHCVYALVSSGMKESTSDFIYAGHGLIYENGHLICENENKITDDYMLYGDVDLGRIRSDRAKDSLFKDATTIWEDETEWMSFDEAESPADGSYRPITKTPMIPQNPEERKKRCLSIFDMQVSALKRRVELVGGKLVVGVSGGLDSTLALLVSVEVMHRLGRPASDVHGITMPCFGTTERTHGNATALMDAIGVTSKEISIQEAAIVHLEDLGHPLDVYDATYENLQARERTQILMDYAGMIGGIVVGTGDLSELALGWCTYNGDHMSMYGVNGGIPKTLMGCIIDSVADWDEFKEGADILRDIIDTPISPELLPPDENGEIAQQTENIVGPYILHDFFIYYAIRYGFAPEKIFYLACQAFRSDFDRPTILKWLKNFYRRFFTQQFKRNCQPDGITIGSVAFSPREDWKMPSDASCKLFLQRLDQIETDEC